MATESSQKPKEYYLFLLVSIFLVSASIISLQIVLQRFLSIVLTYHFVFVIVSLALFGLSMGSLLAYLMTEFLNKYNPIAILVKLAYLFYAFLALSNIASVYVNNHQIFNNNILIYSCIFIFPFLIGGVYWARLFYTFPSVSGQLYGADLLGAAFGCIGIIYLLNRFDIYQVIFVITSTPLVVITLFLIKKLITLKRYKVSLGRGVMICIVLSVSIYVLNLPEISAGKNPQKEIYDALHTFNGKILESRGGALGRVDLVGFEDYPQLMDIYVDGTAGMPMYRFNGDFKDPNPAIQNLKKEFPGYLPLDVINDRLKGNTLVIGPGGGRDILLAKMAGFQKITAVEINPDIVSMVEKYSNYNGNIYNTGDVSLNISEGRNFLRQSSGKYDLIMFSLPVTNTSQGLGSYALTENFLYTREAISEYLDRTNSEGHIVIVTHNDLELLKLFTTTLAVFQDNGISNSAAMRHLYVLGSYDYPVLVIKKQEFAKEESVKILNSALAQNWFIPGASFFPHVKMPYLNNMLLGLENDQRTLQELIKEVDGRGYDIKPVTDLSPFFYKLSRNLPDSLVNIFYVSISVISLFGFLPLLGNLFKKTNGNKYYSHGYSLKLIYGFSLYFLMIGAGFMILEITMIQRFMLVLGNPIFSMSTIIFTILVGAGLGSLTSGRLKSDALHRYLIVSCSAIIFLTLIYIFSLSSIFNHINANSISIRMMITVFLLFPLGFALGFPLPVAIRFMKLRGLGEIIPWMLAINGASSVFGSTLTIILAIKYGYNEALLAAAFCYLVVLIASFKLLSKAEHGFFEPL